MDDKTQFEIATELKGVVKEQTQPLAKRIDELTDSLDELHKRPIPNDGKDGVDGADGQDGAKGDTGEKGIDGVGFDAPVYESGVYREGSVVQAHFGQVYKALKDTAEGVDSEDWERVGTSGFRLTGTYEAEKEYVAGDLFIKGFGLFLHDGAEARLIAGRGPEGKKGEKGATGKDGQDGKDGKDGSTFEALEVKGTNLVAVIRTGEGLQEHAVDLAPFLEATVEVTKSVSEAHTDEAMKALDNQFKSLWETFQQHLTDQQATPVRFFRGGYTPSVTYQAGDLVNFSQSLYVAKQASTGILPHGQLAKDVKSGDYWAMLTSGGGGGGGGGDTELSLYVKRPVPGNLDKWMVYNDAKKQWAVATTDLIETNSSVVFRDSAGRFKSIDVPDLKSQLEVNRWLLEQIELNADSIDNLNSLGYDDTGIKADLAKETKDRIDGDADLQGQINDLKKLHEAPELPPDRLPIYAEDEPTEYPHAEDGDPNDLVAGDQWYQVTDPNFDYNNPDPEGLDLFVWTDLGGGSFEWVLVEPPVEYVKKEGGDSMQGPLNMKQTPGTGSRDSRRINTLGVYSNEGNSYLGIGTDSTKIYVGHSDTSFVNPIKVPKIAEKNDGDGIQVSGGLDIKGDVHFNEKADFDRGMQVVISNPNAVDKTHDEYDEYSRYPLRIKNPSNYNRFAVRVDDGAGPYSLDENGAAFQGSSPPYLATIGLLQDKAVKAYPREVVSMGGLSLTVVNSINDTDDCLYTEAKIQSDYSKIVLNHDPVDNGPRVDWLAQFPDDSTMFIQQGDQIFTLETTAVGAAGANNRAKHFNIRSHDIPDAGLSAGRIDVGETANEANEPYLVSQEEFKESSSHLQAEIEQIALGLETLLTQRTHGKWKYVGFTGDNVPRNAGEFALASDDLSAQDNIITINLTDLNGTTIGLSDVAVGDYIEIVDDDEPANYALFSCTKAPEGTGISNIEVALKDKGNNFLVGDTCEIRFFAINDQNLDLTELDDRFVNTAGDVMTGALETPAIKLSGDKEIREGTNARIKLDYKVEILRPGDSRDGFTIHGRNKTKLLHAYHNPAGTVDAVNYTGLQKEGSSNIATVKFVEEKLESAGGGGVYDYYWNQDTRYAFTGQYLIRKNSYPKEDGDWSIADIDNNYLGNLSHLKDVARIGVLPPWGMQDFKAGYTGKIIFARDSWTDTKPIAVFDVITMDLTSQYFQWYVRLMWCQDGLLVKDLDGKGMTPCQGAVYRESTRASAPAPDQTTGEDDGLDA